jgi:hypothetical protein
VGPLCLGAIAVLTVGGDVDGHTTAHKEAASIRQDSVMPVANIVPIFLLEGNVFVTCGILK